MRSRRTASRISPGQRSLARRRSSSSNSARSALGYTLPGTSRGGGGWSKPRVRVPPALESLLRGFGKQVAEVLQNSVAEALDDGLERVEEKVQEGLGRIRQARGAAQNRSRRG